MGRNSLKEDKNKNPSKSEALADDNLNEDQMIVFFYYGVEIIVRKGENNSKEHFFLYPTMFIPLFMDKTYPFVLAVFNRVSRVSRV